MEQLYCLVVAVGIVGLFVVISSMKKRMVLKGLRVCIMEDVLRGRHNSELVRLLTRWGAMYVIHKPEECDIYLAYVSRGGLQTKLGRLIGIYRKGENECDCTHDDVLHSDHILVDLICGVAKRMKQTERLTGA